MKKVNEQSLISCSFCGSKFNPETSLGTCPYCRTTYPELAEKYKKAGVKEAKRKARLKKALIKLSAFVLIAIVAIILLVSVISGIFRDAEPLVYKYKDYKTTPLFYNDTDNICYYFNTETGKSVKIGKGHVMDFCSSFSCDEIFILFKGNTDIDSIIQDKSIFMSITDGSKTNIIDETSHENISFSAGGNCDYIYYLKNETLGSTEYSSVLYVYDKKSKNTSKIVEYSEIGDYSDFRISANGHYLLYKAEDKHFGGTKLMKYSVKTAKSESLGIKNAEPVSIDNKGIYYSYFRNDDNGKKEFYLESGTQNRTALQLDVPYAERVIISSDYRSFAIETQNCTSIVSSSAQPVIIPTIPGMNIGTEIRTSLNEDLSDYSTIGTKNISYSAKSSFFPYYYISENPDGTEDLLYCENDSVMKNMPSTHFTDFVTNGKRAAYISDGNLYTISIDKKKPDNKLLSEKFSRFTLYSMSANGKYIFCYDEDGNMFKMSCDGNGSDSEKTAVDAQPYEASSDGRKGIYLSDGKILEVCKNQKSERLSETVNPESIYVLPELKKTCFLAKSDNTKVRNAYSMYLYNGKKTVLVSDNILSISGYDFMKLQNDEIKNYNVDRSKLQNDESQSENENETAETDNAAEPDENTSSDQE